MRKVIWLMMALSAFAIAPVYGQDSLFTTGEGYPCLDGIPLLAIDLNQDGYSDVISSIQDTCMTITWGSENGLTGDTNMYVVGYWPLGYRTGDYNRDGKPDINIIGEEHFRIAINTDSNMFELKTPIYITPIFTGFCNLDANGDGILDIVGLRNIWTTSTIVMFYNDGNGNFAIGNMTTVEGACYALNSADFNNDSLLDLIYSCNNGSINIIFNNGNGLFQTPTTYIIGITPKYLLVTDLNIDSYQDLVASNWTCDSISVFFNDGAGGFNTPVYYDVGGNTEIICMDDYNYDFQPDLVVAKEPQIVTLLNSGDGSFQLPIFHDGFGYLSTGDFNGDQLTDLIALNIEDGCYKIHANTGSFTPRICTVIGQVVSPSLSPINNVIITIPGENVADTTNFEGGFSFNSIRYRPIDLRFTAPYYVDTTITHIMLTPHDTTIVNMRLPLCGWLTGYVRDQNDSPVEGVKMVLTDMACTTYSDIDGKYFFDGLGLGFYELQYSKVNYFPDTLESIFVGVGETTHTNVIIQSYPEEFEAWYGRVDNRPVDAAINSDVKIDVYITMRPYVYAGGVIFCLGVFDNVIDSLKSDTTNNHYYPLSVWDDCRFWTPDSSPPNPTDWSSQSYMGYWDTGGAPNPPLHYTTPTKILSFTVHIANDTSLIGDTLSCIGPGLSSIFQHSAVGDTEGGPGYTITEHFSRLRIVESLPACSYTPGDINGDGQRIGGDVTFGVRYFKGTGSQPLDSCFMDSISSWLYVAGDANGNCEFRGSDITRLVAYFKGTAILGYCHWFPPPGK